MIAKVESACLAGLEAARVQVEVSLAKGLPCFSIVGLPDAAVREAKDRVVAAIRNSGFEFPSRRVTVNLAPADLRKEGASFDLAIAVGILLASEAVEPKRWPRCLWLGELALDGTLRAVRGALAMARSLMTPGGPPFVLPVGNVAQVAFLPAARLYPFLRLKDVADWLQMEGAPTPATLDKKWRPEEPAGRIDLADIKGQATAKRALEIAAAGGHHTLFVGCPGNGKSLLAQALPGILPAWNLDEALDASQVHSVAGLLNGEGLLPSRPFRSPHHTISAVGLIGGGDVPLPGEISLAHRGVLFLDELPEFRRDALEALRQPLEEGVVHIQRARGRARYPAEFLWIAAMNPCPCGLRGHPQRECECSPQKIQKYRSRLSGPLLDRVDLQVELPVLDVETLFHESAAAESSADIRRRVERARAVQHDRYRHAGLGPLSNARLGPADVRRHCALSADGVALLKTAVERLGFSARAFDRIRKVARTIADLDASAAIDARHVAEAVQFRALDRGNA